jgi:hypothetical protein
VISHDRAQELISARLDKPLTPAEHRELHAHLASCAACRAFAASSEELAQSLHALPHMAPSPAVSRAVMSAIATESTGWHWLRQTLETLSSPTLAVASSLALVVALAGALLVVVYAPGQRGGTAVETQGTIAAVAVAPLPTEAPTNTPAPTATHANERTIAPAPTERPAQTPTPRPTATQPPIVEVTAPTETPVVDSPPIVPAVVDEPPAAPAAEEPVLAQAPDTGDGSADLAQSAAEPVQTADATVVDEAQPSGDTSGTDAAPQGGSDAAADNGGRKGGRKDSGDKAAEQAPAPTEAPAVATMPVPDEAITAMENAGGAPDVYLPPAPIEPMLPSQSFLPLTPTPEGDGTPTPAADTREEAPQLAEDTSGDLGVTALAPAPPEDVNIDGGKSKNRNKREKSADGGEAIEQKQAAYIEQPMGWSMAPIALPQTAETPVATEVPPETADTGATTPAGTDAAPQIDPATGLEIDPATGYLIDPTTGYLLDLANNRIIDPRTSYLVDPFTGLLIDPATGALLDPGTLEIVVPAGFGSDQPAYVPGSDTMRSDIETVVDDTYDNATYKVEPPTDGPVQPVGEIVIPTESGEAREIN